MKPPLKTELTSAEFSIENCWNLLGQAGFLARWQARESLPLVQQCLNQLMDEVVLPATGDAPVYPALKEMAAVVAATQAPHTHGHWG